MSGFPTRFLRSFLGPRLQNAKPVANPEKEVGAETLEPLLWQVAGMNLGASRASLIATWTGSAFQVHHQSEAWNANGAQAHPVLARTGTGVYTYTFAPTYLNEEDQAIETNLLAARVDCTGPQGAFMEHVTARAWRDPVTTTLVHVRLWLTGPGTPVDDQFWLEVF